MYIHLFGTTVCVCVYIYIYINDIIQKWKRNISPGIKLSREISLNILLYADDVVIKQKNEDDLQRSVHHLKQICKQYNFKISKEKTKVMPFWGKHPIRPKIVLQDRLLEQVSLKLFKV
jgi:hypothetical protein